MLCKFMLNIGENKFREVIFIFLQFLWLLARYDRFGKVELCYVSLC